MYLTELINFHEFIVYQIRCVFVLLIVLHLICEMTKLNPVKRREKKSISFNRLVDYNIDRYMHMSDYFFLEFFLYFSYILFVFFEYIIFPLSFAQT